MRVIDHLFRKFIQHGSPYLVVLVTEWSECLVALFGNYNLLGNWRVAQKNNLVSRFWDITSNLLEFLLTWEDQGTKSFRSIFSIPPQKALVKFDFKRWMEDVRMLYFQIHNIHTLVTWWTLKIKIHFEEFCFPVFLISESKDANCIEIHATLRIRTNSLQL